MTPKFNRRQAEEWSEYLTLIMFLFLPCPRINRKPDAWKIRTYAVTVAPPLLEDVEVYRI